MTLWTPGGEHPVDRQPTPPPPSAPGAPAPSSGPPGDDAAAQAAFEAELEAARQQLEQVPAAVVVSQLAIQCYELAAIHLSRTPPALGEASLAIDTLAAVVERLGDRLGENEPTLRSALTQVQAAFVELSRQADAPGGQTARSDAQ